MHARARIPQQATTASRLRPGRCCNAATHGETELAHTCIYTHCCTRMELRRDRHCHVSSTLRDALHRSTTQRATHGQNPPSAAAGRSPVDNIFIYIYESLNLLLHKSLAEMVLPYVLVLFPSFPSCFLPDPKVLLVLIHFGTLFLSRRPEERTRKGHNTKSTPPSRSYIYIYIYIY